MNSELLEENNNDRRRNFYACLVMAFLYGIGQTVFNIVYQPFLFEITGQSIFMTGFLISIGSILQFLPMPWIGKYSDLLGRKVIWYIGSPFLILGISIFIFIDNIVFLIFGIISYSLGILILNFIFIIFVSENSTETKKGINFGLVYFFFFGGNIIGSFIVLLDTGLTFHFYFLIFLYLVMINLVILILVITDPFPMKNKSKTLSIPIKTEKTIWSKLLRTPKTRSIVLFFTLEAFIVSISWSIYYAGMVDQYHITAQDIALLLFFLNISNLAFQIPSGHLIDKVGKKKSLVISELLSFGDFILIIIAFFLWSGGFKITLLPLLVLVEIISALADTTFISAETLTLTDLDDSKRAESYGIVAFIRGIGIIPTGFIAGLLIENVHYITPFIFTLVGVIFLICFLIKYFQE